MRYLAKLVANLLLESGAVVFYSKISSKNVWQKYHRVSVLKALKNMENTKICSLGKQCYCWHGSFSSSVNVLTVATLFAN